jgi:DNA-binding NtrC family response regulator
VVEDEPLVRDLIVARLCEAGHIVIAASNALEAFEAYRQYRIDLLFTDIRMPGALDGWAIAERLRELNPSLPVVYAVSGSQALPRPVANSRWFPSPSGRGSGGRDREPDGPAAAERLPPKRLSSWAA